MPEISNEALQVLQASYQVLDKLMGNPKTKAATEKLIKEQFPHAVTSQDLADPIIQPLQEKLKELTDWKEKYESDKLDDQLKAAFKRMKDEQHFTDEGIERVKKLMVDRKIADPEAAAALWEKQNPPPAVKPTALTPSTWTIPGEGEGEDKYKRLVENEDAFAREEAVNVLNEFAANGEGV